MTRISSVFNLLKRLGFAVLVLGGSLGANAETFDVLWTYHLGESGAYRLTDAALTSEGFIDFVGSFGETLFSDEFILLGSVSAAGDCLWTVVLDTLEYAAANAIVLYPDNSVIVAGTQADSLDEWFDDALFCRFESDGNLAWTQKVGSPRTERLFSASLSDDGGFLGCGFRDPAGADIGDDLYLVKVDSATNVLWERGYRPTQNAYTHGTNIVRSRFSGYAVLGFARSDGFGTSQLYFVRIDDNGDTLWTRSYGALDIVDESAAIYETEDGGFLIAGNTAEPGFPLCAVRCVRVDASGVVLWEQVLPLPCSRYPWVTDVSPAQSGGWLLCGSIFSANRESFDYMIAGIDDNGENFWYTTFPSGGDGAFEKILPIEGGGYFFIGDALSVGNFSHEIVIYRVTTENLSSESHSVPTNVSIVSAYPNPFNSNIRISLEAPLHSEIEVTLYDLLGREVDVIYRGRLAVSTISYTAPAALASGIYFVQASTGVQAQIKKVVLLK